MSVDAVIVSYQSRDSLRAGVEPLSQIPGVRVTVLDNASSDGSLESIADLPVTRIASDVNGGFAYGCNRGAADGDSPYVLLLNPDARIDAESLSALVSVLDSEPAVALVAPRLLDDSGELSWSQRRFPRLRSTYAQALFLHRLFPRATWTDELIRDPAAYQRSGSPDWVSGACMLVRRTALEQIGGLDEGFFLYCEDIDLCRRLRGAGHEIRFEPKSSVRHIGGVSRPFIELRGVLTASRVRYARLHNRPMRARLETTGIALGEATHALRSLHRPSTARGHVAALRVAMRRARNPASAGAR